MAKPKTDAKDKAKDKPAAEAPPAAAQAVAVPDAARGVRLRLGYPRTAQEAFGVDARTWQVLIDAVWPAARTPEAVMLALAYCKSRNLDPLKKVVHIVPVWSKDGPKEKPTDSGGYIETVWPGIAEIRTTATRTLAYAGKDATKFGPMIEREFAHTDTRERDTSKQTKTVKVTFPEWAEVTVYKMVQGVRCPFVGPRVYWTESYATESKWSEIPNTMWLERPSGQLEKCAEAGSLRAAFPEELGGEYAAEEVNGRIIEHSRPREELKALLPGEVAPPAQKTIEFARAEPAPKAEPEKKDVPQPEQKKPESAGAQPQGDPRPEPPMEGEVVTPAAAEDGDDEEEEGPADLSQAPDEARAGIVAMLDEAGKRLAQCTKGGQVADLREEIEQENPPAFTDLLKEWNDSCDAKQKLIIDARPKK